MVADGAWHGRRRRRARPPGRAVRRAARLGAATRCSTCWPAATRPTRSPSCGRGWSGTASTGTLTARAGRAAARGHQRRHDPRPRPVRRLPAPAPSGPAPGRRARRGDGLRVAGRRRVPARLVVLADRGHHPRPGAGHPRARAARAGCRSGRATRRAGRWSWAGRSARSCARSARRRRRPAWSGPGRPGSTSGARPTCWPTWPSSRRRPATCPTTGRSWSSGSATSWATGGWSCTRPSARRSTRRGRWRSAARLRERYGVDVAGDALRRRHRAAAARHRPASRPSADLAVFDPDEIERDGHRRGRRLGAVRRAGSGSARPGRCCCPAATRAGARRCGSSGSAPRSCSTVASEYAVVPDRPGGGPRVPAGRLRRARPGRADARRARPARCALVEVRDRQRRRRSPGRCCSATSARSSTRATRRWPSGGPQALALDTDAARRAARPGRAARAARRRRAGRGRGRAAAAAPRSGSPATSTDVADLLRVLGDLTDGRGWPRAARRRTWLDRAGGRPAGDPGADRRRGALGRHRGRRPAARRARHGAAGRRPGGVHRAGRRPARRPRRAATPAPTARSSRGRRARPGSGSASPWSPRRCSGSPRTGRVVEGEFRPGGSGQEWCDAEVLRLAPPARRWRAAPGGRAGADRRAGPVPAGLAGRRRAGCAASTASLRGRRAAGRARWCRPRALETLGAARPGRRLLPRDARRADQRRRGAVGRGRRAARRRRLDQPRARRPRAAAAARAARERRPTPLHDAVLDALAGGQALFFRGAVRPGRRHRRRRAGRRWSGTWSGPGVLTNDTLAPLRARLGGGGTHRSSRPRRAPGRRSRYGRARPGRPAMPTRTGPPTVAGPLVAAARPGAEPDPAGAPRAPRRCWTGTAW